MSKWEPGRRGFTLIEVIICIAIIGILVALFLPSMRAMRSAGGRARDLSVLRQHAAVSALYRADWRETFLYFGQGTVGVQRLYLAEAPRVFEYEAFFLGSYHWREALRGVYYDRSDRGLFSSWESKKRYREVGLPFDYSCVFFAHREYWTPETRTDLSQAGAIRESEVVFPSQKSLYVDQYELLIEAIGRFGPERVAGAPRVTMAFVDGSAAGVPASRVRPGMRTRDGTVLAGYHSEYTNEAGTHTLEGAAGRDVDARAGR